MQNNATKQCMENGEWYVNPEYNRIWTNYTECWTFYDEESAVVGIRTDYKQLENVEIYQKFFPVLKVVTQIGYSFSLLLLITSLFVFFFIKYTNKIINNANCFYVGTYIFFVEDCIVPEISCT